VEAGVSVDGAWIVNYKTPIAALSALVTLDTGAGTVTGTMKSMIGEMPIESGSAEGDHVSWQARMPHPAMELTMEFTGDVDGDAISGTVTMGPLGTVPFTGTRARE
jgi:hypothetical protein